MILDIDDLQKRLTPTWFDFKQDISDAAIDKCLDHLADTLNTCSDMNVHLYDSSEHFTKLSM